MVDEFRDAVTPHDGLVYAIYRAELYKKFLAQYECDDPYNILSTLIGMLNEDVQKKFPLYCKTGDDNV